MQEGITILVSTAYLDEAERTTRTAFMREGSIMELGTPKELKQTVEGHMIEIIPSDSRAAREVLKADPRILDVSLFGDSLHVRLSDVSDEAHAKEALEKVGIEIKSFRRIAPAMEDVFLSVLTGKGNRA